MSKKDDDASKVAGCGVILLVIGIFICTVSPGGIALILIGIGILIAGFVILFDNTKSSTPKLHSKKSKPVSPKSTSSTKWISEQESFSVAGENIGNFIYAGERLLPINNSETDANNGQFKVTMSSGANYDAALIRPSLKVNLSNPDLEGKRLDYWPSYTNISPTSRGAYLLWLSAGKSDPKAPLGYVFLYFYGLERRLLFDHTIDINNDEPRKLINELIRLFSIYAIKSRSFKNYAANLIYISILKYLQDDLDIIPDPMLECLGTDINPIICFKLAKLSSMQLPVPARWAFALLKNNPEINLKMPAKRCSEEFKKLFFILYEEAYNNGFIIKPSTRRLNFNYKPASPTLVNKEKLFSFPASYTNVSSLKGVRKKVESIANKCYFRLDQYSRLIGRAPHLKDTLEAVLLLPSQLITDGDERINNIKQELINKDMQNRGLRSINLKRLCDIIGIPTQDDLSTKAIRDIKNSMARLGLGLSPDYEYCGLKAEKRYKVVIFQVNSKLTSSDIEKVTIQHIMLFLRLGMLIAAADGNVSKEEIEYLAKMIEKNNLSENSRMRLWAFLEFLLNNKVDDNVLKKNIEKLSENHKELLVQEMTALVQVDGKIDKKEIFQLEKIFKMLRLDSKLAITHLHQSQIAYNEPVVVAHKAKLQDFKIPSPKEKTEAKPIIDYNKVAMKQKETEEASILLEKVFKDEDISFEEASFQKLSSLDEKHQQFFDFLIAKSEWPRITVEEFCKPLQLMVDGAMEVINEYARLKYEEPLLEGDDPIYVELELAQEIQNG